MAASVMVFIHTNPFATNQPQYYNQMTLQLPVASNDSTEIISYALQALNSIFKQGYEYKKAGVVVGNISPERPLQTNLFDTRNRSKYHKAMQAMDKLNASFGRQKVKIAAQGFDRKWKLKNEKLSPCYTTNINDILTVKAE
jgi:DNA polymerase V